MSYQSILFSRSDGPDKYSMYIRDSEEGIKKFNYFNTVYKIDPEGEHISLFGDRCTAINGKYDRTDNTILEKDITRELACLRDYYYETDDIPSFHNIVYLDIEIEMLGALDPASIRAAEAEITAIALEDVTDKQYFCYILDKTRSITDSHIENKHVISCSSEKDLMRKFLNKWQELDPTIVVHFNGDFFDIPYLYYRIKKKLGDEVYRLSPVGKIEENIYNPQSPIKIGLVNSLDYLLLFKKYITKVEPSYKLGDLGEKYVNLGKISYEGNLDKLFKEDVNKFIEYNLRDVEIIEALDEKFKFIDLTILICHLGHVPYESIYYSTVVNEGAMLTYLKRKGIIAPNKPTTMNPSLVELFVGDAVINQRGTPALEGIIHSINGYDCVVKTLSGRYVDRTIKSLRINSGYSGGFLLDIKPGLYKYLIDIDFSSLYPSLIRTLNLGIETLKGRIVVENQNYELWNSMVELKERDPDEMLTIEKLDKRTYTLKQAQIPVSELIELIEKNKWTISANGTLFDSQKSSIAVEVLADWFRMRQQCKKDMKEAFKKGDTKQGELLDLKQYAIKIALNSLYGNYAVCGWRFSDGWKICSAAITTTGQRTLNESLKQLNTIIEDKYEI